MSTNSLTTTTAPKASLVAAMASHYGMEPDKFYGTIMATVMPSGATPEQVAAFLLVANRYTLDPFTKEIYAFKGQGGAVQPIIGIDGWMTLANRQPDFDGIDFEDHRGADGKIEAITAKVYRKDRSHPVVVTEYLVECRRDTPPWRQTPSRMLRHRAAAQGIRYAFGIGGVMLDDEAEQAGYEVVASAPLPNGSTLSVETPAPSPAPAAQTEPGPDAEHTPAPAPSGRPF